MNRPLPPAVIRGRRVVVALFVLSAVVAAGTLVTIIIAVLERTGLFG
jgi:hypothetical protein